MTNSFKTLVHGSEEESLLAAKRTVRSVRNACIHRRTEMPGDVIDILVGMEVIERHVCCSVTRTPQVQVRPRYFCIEEMALYQ